MGETLLAIVGLVFIVSAAISILFCILYPVQKHIYMKKWRINKSSDFMRNSVDAHFKYVKNIRNASLIFMILYIIIFFIMSLFIYPAEESIDNTELATTPTIAISNNYVPENKQQITNEYKHEEETTTVKELQTFILGIGQYIVGEDIPAGKYDCIAVEGSGNFMGDVEALRIGLNVILGASGTEWEESPSYSNLRLSNGDVIEIMGTLQIEFREK